MSVRHLVCLGLAACVMPASGFAQADGGVAARNWGQIAQCGSITDDERRLDCMDEVLRAAGVATSTTSSAAPRQQIRPSERAEASPGAPARRTAEVANNRAGPLSTTIASVRTVGYQRLLVTTAEGSVWEQTEDESFGTLAKAGDAFSVEPAAMGSFRCRFNQSSRYRCKQVN